MSQRQEFTDLFEHYEFTLKRRGFLQKGLEHAQADWNVFARSLGQDFFDYVRAAGIAETLIAAPPGKLMRNPLDWNRPDRALATTYDLLVQGVCRVRNSLVHGEKFRGDIKQRARDEALISEALAVLKAAEGFLATAEPGAEAGS